MSTGANCRFTETAPGQWRYWLQNWPYGEEPTGQTFGPFRSFAAAREHLDENHANPGGYDVDVLETGHVHEWSEDSYRSVPQGVTVTIEILSLGNEPTPADILAALRSTVGVQHLGIRPRLVGTVVTACPCGEVKPESQPAR